MLPCSFLGGKSQAFHNYPDRLGQSRTHPWSFPQGLRSRQMSEQNQSSVKKEKGEGIQIAYEQSPTKDIKKSCN